MKCPGQDTQQWKPGDIFEMPCSNCGRIIEFFKDDTSRRCKGCGARVLNPKMDFGCAAYCAFADQCLVNCRLRLLRSERIFSRTMSRCEMRRYFGTDQKTNTRMPSGLPDVAERILDQEPADFAVVMAAAYLHDIGIREAEKRYQSSEARYQEELGPQVARTLLESLKADAKLVDEVCDIIGHHHHPRTQETDNFKVLYDADCIVNLEEDGSAKPRDRENLAQVIGENLLTETGKALARERLSV